MPPGTGACRDARGLSPGRVRPGPGRHGCCRCRRARACTGRVTVMKWNLRLAAASRGIWKASELQKMLAERGMVISAGKMSGLWSGSPNAVKLADLDVICAMLGRGTGELLIPGPVP